MPKAALGLSIVIPAYNEANRISATLADIAKYFVRIQPPQNFSQNHTEASAPESVEVIVVDDGSSDQTSAVVRRITEDYPVPLRLEQLSSNQGKGAAVRAGVAVSRGAWILLMDADNATPITELPRLWERRSEAPLILGSRYLAGSSITRAQPLLRRIISRVGNLLIRLLVGLNLTDTQNGFKLLAGPEARAIFTGATIDRWGFDIEILAIAQAAGLRIIEVPVAWSDAAGSKLRAGRDAWRTLKELIKIRSNLSSGVYQK